MSDIGKLSTSDSQRIAEAAANAMFSQDHASQAMGMNVIEVRPGWAQVSMLIRNDMVNGLQTCHGGIIFMLADSTFAFACNSYNTATVASAATIEFLRPGRLGDQLIATATERSRSRKTGVYDIEVRNQTGECIALFRGRSYELNSKVTDIST